MPPLLSEWTESEQQEWKMIYIELFESWKKKSQFASIPLDLTNGKKVKLPLA